MQMLAMSRTTMPEAIKINLPIRFMVTVKRPNCDYATGSRISNWGWLSVSSSFSAPMWLNIRLAVGLFQVGKLVVFESGRSPLGDGRGRALGMGGGLEPAHRESRGLALWRGPGPS